MSMWKIGAVCTVWLGFVGLSASAAPPAGPGSPWASRVVARRIPDPVAAEPEVEPRPARSQHRRPRTTGRPTLPRYLPGRPPVTPAPWESWATLRPSAVGHPSRPVVTPLPHLNVVSDPHVSVYVPGRPVAHPLPGLSIITPHYVVGEIRPELRWLGAGRLRTARRVAPLR